MKHSICHFEYPPDDPEALVTFYTELIGWESEQAGEDYWLIHTGGGLGGGIMRKQQPGQQPVNYICVEDLDAYTQKAQELGAQVRVPRMEVPGMGWFAVLSDRQDNPFALFQPAEMP